MQHNSSIDQGVTWCCPPLDQLRFMRATYIQHSFKPHIHDYFVLGIIEAGVQSFTHGRKHHITTPGKVIIINPGEVHTGQAAIPEGFTYRALYPSLNLMSRIAGEFKIDTALLPTFSSGLIYDPHIYRHLLALHRWSEYAPSRLEVEERVTRLLVALIQSHSVEKLNLPTYYGSHQAVSQVRDYLETHYADSVTLEDLSNHVYISPYHLVRLFARHVGIPPHKYLETIRISHAEQLLNQGMSVVEVAYATGFSSQSHLTRTFKRFIGTTPGAFLHQRKIV